MSKTFLIINEASIDASACEVPGESTVPERYRGTLADHHDMIVLGKKQVLRRNFKFVTMIGFSSTVG